MPLLCHLLKQSSIATLLPQSQINVVLFIQQAHKYCLLSYSSVKVLPKADCFSTVRRWCRESPLANTKRKTYAILSEMMKIAAPRCSTPPSDKYFGQGVCTTTGNVGFGGMEGNVKYRLVKFLAVGGNFLYARFAVQVPQSDRTIMTFGRRIRNKWEGHEQNLTSAYSERKKSIDSQIQLLLHCITNDRLSFLLVQKTNALLFELAAFQTLFIVFSFHMFQQYINSSQFV